MRPRFAERLRARREAVGYASARAFFMGAGGERFFGCTYKAYVNVERGLAAPTPRLLTRLVAALRLAIGRRGAHEFAVAALNELLGAGEFSEFALRVFKEGRPSSRGRGRVKWLDSPPARAGGKTLLEHPLFFRASRGELLRFAPHIQESVRSAAESAIERSGQRYVVELSIDELLEF